MLRYGFIIAVIHCMLPLSSGAAENTLDLHQSIQLALQYNPRIEIARQACLQSQGRLTQAQSGYLPQVDIAGSYGRNHLNDLEPLEEDNVGYGTIGASQLIYDFGRTTGGIAAGRHGLDASRHNYVRLLQNVVFDVKTRYYLLLERRWLVAVAREAVENFRQHADRAKELFAVGVRTKIDVTNAQVMLSNARLDLLKAESNAKSARIAFEKALGTVPHDGNYSLVSDKGSPQQAAASKPPLDMTLEAILSTALQSHPVLLSTRALLLAAQSSVNQEKGGYFPAFNAFAGYDTYETELSGYYDQWQLGVGLRWNIFSGFYTKGKVAEAMGRQQELQARLRDLQLAVTKEATESYLRAEESSRSVDLAAEILDLAAENLEVAEGRYKEGLSDVIEFNDAQFNQTRSQSDFLNAYYAYLISLARIEKATGVVPELAALPDSVFTSCSSITAP